MTLYSNGLVPESRLIKIASGTDVNGYWEHLISAGTLRKWNAALAYAQRKWGKVMRISTGWNVYRPLRIQKDARARAEARGEPNSAARAGWSSHGGTWVSSKHTGGRWVDALAIDVVPQRLTWAQVDEAMRAAGFLVGAITKQIAGMNEPWHYIDLDPWAAVPASTPTKPIPAVVPEEEDDDMKNCGFYYTRASDKAVVVLIVNFGSGIYHEYTNGKTADGAYNGPIAATTGTGSYAPITEAHARVIKAACDKEDRLRVVAEITGAS